MNPLHMVRSGVVAVAATGLWVSAALAYPVPGADDPPAKPGGNGSSNESAGGYGGSNLPPSDHSDEEGTPPGSYDDPKDSTKPTNHGSGADAGDGADAASGDAAPGPDPVAVPADDGGCAAPGDVPAGSAGWALALLALLLAVRRR